LRISRGGLGKALRPLRDEGAIDSLRDQQGCVMWVVGS
jgi:hypothetical protein